jgi:hypothetical protein
MEEPTMRADIVLAPLRVVLEAADRQSPSAERAAAGE